MSCLPEIVSVAPMLECTDRHFRYFLRGITRCTTLYTEMVVDTTLTHQENNLEFFIGLDRECADPTVIQLGGHDAEDLARASLLCDRYGGYSEINLNCGCPSPKVTKRCFGARLMLEPDLVRELVHSMCRVSSIPVVSLYHDVIYYFNII
jgi:tRNA-dihydrouridine synthase A